MNEIKSMAQYGTAKGFSRGFRGRGKLLAAVMVSIAEQTGARGRVSRSRIRISISADIMRRTGFRFGHCIDMAVVNDTDACLFISESGRTLGPSGGGKCIGPDTRGVVQFSLYDGMGFRDGIVKATEAAVVCAKHKELHINLPDEVLERPAQRARNSEITQKTRDI